MEIEDLVFWVECGEKLIDGENYDELFAERLEGVETLAGDVYGRFFEHESGDPVCDACYLVARSEWERGWDAEWGVYVNELDEATLAMYLARRKIGDRLSPSAFAKFKASLTPLTDVPSPAPAPMPSPAVHAHHRGVPVAPIRPRGRRPRP